MRVLIVEDDMVIAGGLKPIIAECGHEVVGLAADRDSAIALIDAAKVELALVDLRLTDGWTGPEVARAAAIRGVTAAFTTANPGLLPDDLAGACGVILKPYTDEGIRSALAYISQMRAGVKAPVPPRGFVAATSAAGRPRAGIPA